jgi:hypothetical protein
MAAAFLRQAEMQMEVFGIIRNGRPQVSNTTQVDRYSSIAPEVFPGSEPTGFWNNPTGTHRSLDITPVPGSDPHAISHDSEQQVDDHDLNEIPLFLSNFDHAWNEMHHFY